MTEKELRLEYKKETGKYPVEEDSLNLCNGSTHCEKQLVEYTRWLEKRILTPVKDTILEVQNSKIGQSSKFKL